MEHKKKRKALRIAGITAGSILAVIILAVATVAAVIFSPKRLTPIAAKALDVYFPGKAELSNVGITYFKTRPYLGIDIRGITIYDGMEESPYDKILEVGSLAASFDLKSFLKEDKFIIKGLYLDKTSANLYTSPEGKTNLDFLLGESSQDEPESDSNGLIYAELRSLAVKDLNAEYRNDSTVIKAGLNKVQIDLQGYLHNEDSIEASVETRIKKLYASIQDSININTEISDVILRANASKFDKNGNIKLELQTGLLTAESGSISAKSDGISLDAHDMTFDLDGYAISSLEGSAALHVNKLFAQDQSSLSAETEDITLNVGNFSFKEGWIKLAEAVLNTGKIEYTSKTDKDLMSASIDSIRLVANADCDTAITDITSSAALQIGDIQFITKDDSLNLRLKVQSPALNAGATIREGKINISADLATGGLSTVMNDETMTDKWPLRVHLPSVDTDTTITFLSVSDKSYIEVKGERIEFGADAIKKNQKISGNVLARIANLNIEKVIDMIPESYRSNLDGIEVKGVTDIEANLKGDWSDAGAALHKISAKISASDFYTLLYDSIEVNADHLDAKLESPDGHAAKADISSNNLDLMMITESIVKANLKDVRLQADILDIADSLMAMTASANIDVKTIQASMDTISAKLDNASITADMFSQSNKPTFAATLGFEKMNAAMGNSLNALVGKTSMEASAQYDSTETDILGMWDPKINFVVERSNLDMLDDPIVLEGLNINFDQGSFNIKEGKVSLGNSNIELWGDIYNIGPFMRDEGLLTGELYLESDYVDVTQLMNYTSGMGQDDSDEKTVELPADTVISDTLDAVPFVVPRGIDLALYTNFSEIEFNHHTFNNVGGDVTIKDGKVIMQEVGFSSNTAEMQLTAIYDAPEEDNRFIELDFHLLDIQIDELIDLIPSVDSIVPMLKAFKGEAQFHLAAETKLQRDNMPKMSTLLGAAVIEGKDLVIMDNDVFKGIKRKLLMSKKAQNKIDDLNIEMQVFRDKVDLYPFLIHMDKYNAVIGGRHNINKGLDCRYHISLTDSPLPFRLGVTVSGPITEISDKPLKHIKIARCEYDKLFKPSRRSDVEERTLAIRKDIAETLKSNVR